MDLSDLGFDDEFAASAREHCGAELALARVTAVDRQRYLVRDALGEVPAELTGRFLHLSESSVDLPCVGDWVCVRMHDDRGHASVERLLPRRSFVRRKVAGRDVEFQMIAANIDLAFVVQGCQFDFNVRRLERYLVMLREGGIEPVVLLTKTDLVEPSELAQMLDEIRGSGITARVIALSNLSGEGIDEVRALVRRGKTCCFLGSSGVGKTTLINRLAGGNRFETGAVSHTGEGRHTTTRRQLILLEQGGLLIDMPGMRELGMLATESGIEETFGDVAALAARCRFADCSHAGEPGCAVRAAIERGELSEARLDHYLKLRKESEFHESSYLERRRKDRAFGRAVRSVIRHKDKRRPT